MSSKKETPGVPVWADRGGGSVTDWRWAETPSEMAATGIDCIEYIGKTALVVTGPYTGARYRFRQPGARLPVDARDRQAMLSIPMLRAVAQ